MIIAAVNYEIQPIRSVEDFLNHGRDLLSQAKTLGADWAVFPEFFTLELLHLYPELDEKDLAAKLSPDVLDPLVLHARDLGLVWVAGSTFSPSSTGILNVSSTFFPDGSKADQAKVILTQFEAVDWAMSPGRGLKRFPDPRFGLAICYDCEFPEAGRALAEAGALCMLVPSYTETRHGFYRVRHSCHARAIENQIYVVQTCLVGSLGREPVPIAVGSSAILAPSVLPFPADGILAQTPADIEAIAIAELDFDALLKSRTQGDVRNWEDRHRGDWTVSDA